MSYEKLPPTVETQMLIRMTRLGIYGKLRRQYLNDYKGHFIDEYDGQNKLQRMANIYAVKNTQEAWKKQ